MGTKIILGVDPGLAFTGWGVVLKENSMYKFLGAGTIETSSKDQMPARLHAINSGMKEVLEKYSIDEAAVEETFVNKNNLSSLKLGHARGAIILTLSLADVPISEYSATNVKKSVVGTGRAEKGQIGMMVKTLIPKAVISSEHEADALAIAICHGNTSRYI